MEESSRQVPRSRSPNSLSIPTHEACSKPRRKSEYKDRCLAYSLCKVYNPPPPSSKEPECLLPPLLLCRKQRPLCPRGRGLSILLSHPAKPSLTCGEAQVG